MIMADVLAWFFGVAAVYLVLVCEWLVAAALAPDAVQECRRQYTRPIRATLTGLVVAAPLVLFGLGVASRAPHPLPKMLSIGFLLLLLLPAFFGSAGLAARIGAGIAAGAEARPARRVLQGGLVLVPTLLVPVLGWFILLPWTLISGFGAALLAWRSGRALPQASGVA